MNQQHNSPSPTPSTAPSPSKKWTAKETISVISLVFLPIIGVILMWFIANWSKRTKVIITLAALFVPIIIVALITAGTIMYLNPDDRMLEAREATRESHMITIGNAIHLAVIDCEEGEEDYCAKVSAVVEECRVSDEDWRFKPDASNCTIAYYMHPTDPLTGGEYYIDADGGYNVKIWADADESEWRCSWDYINNQCRGTNYKKF